MESGADMHYKERGVITKADALNQTIEMGKHFNCSEDNKKLLQCLRGIDAKDILNYTGITTFPLDGTEFIPLSAQKAFKEGKYSKG